MRRMAPRNGLNVLLSQKRSYQTVNLTTHPYLAQKLGIHGPVHIHIHTHSHTLPFYEQGLGVFKRWAVYRVRLEHNINPFYYTEIVIRI